MFWMSQKKKTELFKMSTEKITENTGTAIPAVHGNRTGAVVLIDEEKNLPTFCPDAIQIIRVNLVDPVPGLFEDRFGLFWFCRRWRYCEHAIIVDDTIRSCQVRSKQVKDIERGRPE